MFWRECVRAPAHDDFHFVSALEQLLADDFAARCVAHAFADNAVENSHGAIYLPRDFSLRT